MISKFNYPIVSSIKLPSSQCLKFRNEVKQLLGLDSRYDHKLLFTPGARMLSIIAPGGDDSILGSSSNGEDFLPTIHARKCPEIIKFICSLPGKKYSCRLSTFENGAEILPHRDYFRSIEFGVIRLHVPIITNRSVTFNIDGKSIHLSKNNLHFVDISKIHYVSNVKIRRRVHLLIDIEVTKELIKLLKLPSRLNKLPFLQKNKLRKSLPLQKLSIKIPREKLPFPLLMSKALWRIKPENNEWYFSSGIYKFKILKNSQGCYYLESVGLGFTFYLTENYFHCVCSGALILKDGKVKIGSIAAKIKTNKKLEKGTTRYKRSSSFIEIPHLKTTLILVNISNAKEYYLLDNLMFNIWKKCFHYEKEEDILKNIKDYSNSRIKSCLLEMKKNKLLTKAIF